MNRKTLKAAGLGIFTVLLSAASAWQVRAQDAKTPYPNMAPAEQYMMDRGAETALALTAAPKSISGDADVMVMGRHGYETAVKGKNGFVCLVERAWMTENDDPQFWNPKLRAPICFNPAAARTVVPITMKKTALILAGQSKPQMAEAMKAAFANGELPKLEPGAMCYMMSKQGYLNDRDGHWHPHLMFFQPLADEGNWGANLPESPIYAAPSPDEHMTVFFVPIGKWSDGTSAAEHAE